MPTHEPELSEPYYSGDFYEGGPATPGGAKLEYRYTKDDGYSFDPDTPGEVEWLSEPVASGEELEWGSEAGKRLVGEAILTHYYRRAATVDELDLFVEHIAPGLEDGQELVIGVGDLVSAGLER